MPIITQDSLLDHADDVARSVASACCYLAWSILTPAVDEGDCLWPRIEYADWARPPNLLEKDPRLVLPEPTEMTPRDRIRILGDSREMGLDLKLVDIARDIKKDALLNRMYIPLSSILNNVAILSFLHLHAGKPTPSTRPYVLDLLQVAMSLRQKTAASMESLPREAKGCSERRCCPISRLPRRSSGGMARSNGHGSS